MSVEYGVPMTSDWRNDNDSGRSSDDEEEDDEEDEEDDLVLVSTTWNQLKHEHKRETDIEKTKKIFSTSAIIGKKKRTKENWETVATTGVLWWYW